MRNATKLLLQQNTKNIFSNMKTAHPFLLNVVWKNPNGGPKAKLKNASPALIQIFEFLL